MDGGPEGPAWRSRYSTDTVCFSSCVFCWHQWDMQNGWICFFLIFLSGISHSKRCQDSQHWMMGKSGGKPYISCRFSLNEPSHPRRFLDKKEMDARSKELRAAAIAGIPHDELDYFRAAQLQSSELHKTSRYWYHMWETHEQTGDCSHHPANMVILGMMFFLRSPQYLELWPSLLTMSAHGHRAFLVG